MGKKESDKWLVAKLLGIITALVAIIGSGVYITKTSSGNQGDGHTTPEDRGEVAQWDRINENEDSIHEIKMQTAVFENELNHIKKGVDAVNEKLDEALRK